MGINKYEESFLFIGDIALRNHLGSALEFVVHLLSLILDANQKEIIKNALCKTIEIYTASIVEAVIHYYV